MFLPESQWLEALQDSVDVLLDYVQGATHSLPLPLAQATLQRATGESRYVTEAVVLWCSWLVVFCCLCVRECVCVSFQVCVGVDRCTCTVCVLFK